MSIRASVVGGILLDIIGESRAPLAARDSNAGRIRFAPGGVGRNIAACLAAQGARTRLFAGVSRDPFGQMLKDACAREGIDLSFARETDARCACYMSIHGPDGDMALAVNDMDATAAAAPEYLERVKHALWDADVCVLDANLNEESLAFFLRDARAPLVADPVSCQKARRLMKILPKLAAIKPNRMEAELLTGETRVPEAARALVHMGVKRAILSLGEEGAYFADEFACGYMPLSRRVTCQTTGAGDAMCAGIALGVAMGESARECAARGMALCARLLNAREDAAHGADV